MADEPDGETEIPVFWPGDAGGLPVALANAFALQGGPDGVIITVGLAIPPLLSGSPEAQQAEAKQMKGVPALPLGRFLVPYEQTQSLMRNLAVALANAAAQGRIVLEDDDS